MKRIYNDINLQNRNSFGVMQSAQTLVEFECADDLCDYFAEYKPKKWYVLGAGNNTLFTQDYDGVIFTPVSRAMSLLADDDNGVLLRVDAAADWDELVAWSVENGLWGMENLPDHELFIQTGPHYFYTETGYMVAETRPFVRVEPAVPMAYKSHNWDFGWAIVRSDGHVAGLWYDPYTLKPSRTFGKYAMRWFVRY